VARGLPRPVQNLVILTFAAQTNRSFFLHGGALRPDLQKVDDDVELRTERLPAAADWDTAVQRAASNFGVTASGLLNAANASRLAEDLIGATRVHGKACANLVTRLHDSLREFTVAPERANRLITARATLSLLDAIAAAGPAGAIPPLPGASTPSSEAAMGSNLRKASELAPVLESTSWAVFESLRGVAPEKAARARQVLDGLQEALSSDEYAVALGPRLKRLHDDALALIVERKKEGVPSELVEEGSKEGLAADEGRTLLQALVGRLVNPQHQLDISW